MIKKRLIELLSSSKKYIYQQVAWQWVSLIIQILFVFSLSMIFKIRNNHYYFDKVWALVCLCCVFLRYISDKKAVETSFKAGSDVKRTLREKIYKKLLKLKSDYREKISTAEVVFLSVEGVEQLEIYFSKYLPQLFYSLLAPLTLFVVLSRVSFKVSFVLLACIPMIPLSIVAVQKIAKKLLNKYWSIYAGLGDSFLENLQGLTTLKIYSADADRAVFMDEEANLFRRITMKVLTMQLNSTSVMDIMAYGGSGIGMVLTVGEYLSGNISVQGAIFIILLAAEFFIPMRVLGSFFHIAMNGMAASDKIFHLLDIEEEIDSNGEFVNGEIAFDGVRFSYNEDREILKGISFKVKEKSFVSLVGVSGCGKSTIAKLLTMKNRKYLGSIKIGGIELSKINNRNLLDNITLVTHNSHIFKGSIKENLLMAKLDASDEELNNVLKMVNLYDFAYSQNGLNTLIAEKGSNISGGQAQRLAIARSLLHESEIYIFDEATSNIDKESEEIIMNVIRKLSETKTIILISHRLKNVVDSDCIYMMNDGYIVESGKHNDLMQLNGFYSELYNVQSELETYGGAL